MVKAEIFSLFPFLQTIGGILSSYPMGAGGFDI
jgi:hypothetical protein